ncbi:MAG: hypothetical protein ACF788_05920 [Novipirellula sp. JB048]
MKTLCFTNVAILMCVLVMPVEMASGGDRFSLRQRTRTRSHLPAHNYNHGTWPYTTPQTFVATAVAIAAPGPSVSDIKIKPFHFHATALRVNHLTLDRVGIAIDQSDGRVIASGRITHHGGDDGLIGSNVTIRIRAYASYRSTIAPDNVIATDLAIADPEVLPVTPTIVTQVPPDAYMVWSSERSLWVSRGAPRHISLLPESGRLFSNEALKGLFENATHMEVELEHQADR